MMPERRTPMSPPRNAKRRTQKQGNADRVPLFLSGSLCEISAKALQKAACNHAKRNESCNQKFVFFCFCKHISPHFLIFYPYACWYIPRIDETYAIYASLPKSRLMIWKIPHPYDRTPAICPHVAHNTCFLGIFLQICTDDCRFRFFIQWNQRHGLKIFRDNLFIVFSSFVVIIGNTHQIVLRQKSCIVCFLQGTK